MDSLGKILKTRVKEIGFARQAGALEVLKLAEEYIKGSFNPVLAEKFSPTSFKNKILNISCSGGAAASELKFHEKSLLDFLNLKLRSDGAVEKIRISLS